jgi:hypothetical protein
MNDNVFYAALTAVIAAMAISVSAAEANDHVFARPAAKAAATQAPEARPAGQEVILLPRVEVVGHRPSDRAAR